MSTQILSQDKFMLSSLDWLQTTLYPQSSSNIIVLFFVMGLEYLFRPHLVLPKLHCPTFSLKYASKDDLAA